MAIDDIAKAGKVAKAAKAAKAAKEATEVIVEFRGARYSFPAGTTKEQAERVLWNKVVRPTVKGDVEEVTLPSELPKERVAEVEASLPTAEVIEFKPKKLDPGVYLDEDTGKYFKIDKDGNMEELTGNETP